MSSLETITNEKGSDLHRSQSSTFNHWDFCQTPVLGLGLEVDFTFALNNHENHKNPHLNFVKGTVLGDKEQGEGIRDKG